MITTCPVWCVNDGDLAAGGIIHNSAVSKRGSAAVWFSVDDHDDKRADVRFWVELDSHMIPDLSRSQVLELLDALNAAVTAHSESEAGK